MRPAAAPIVLPSSVDTVFERLLAAIVSGAYPAGARLPAERDLAPSLGTSRPTLREALSRLAEWGLVETRRGSGVVVRPRRDWGFDVLPAFLRFGAAAAGPAVLAQVVRDLLELRRALFIQVVRMVKGRLGPGALGEARRHVAAAWAAREDVEAFAREDLEAVRATVDAAGILPAQWLLASMGTVYRAIAENLSGRATCPPDYQRVYQAVFDHLEHDRVEDACRELDDYLKRHDRRLLGALGVRP
jgi:DNA-binding FadR family transcriptional regulator